MLVDKELLLDYYIKLVKEKFVNFWELFSYLVVDVFFFKKIFINFVCEIGLEVVICL